MATSSVTVYLSRVLLEMQDHQLAWLYALIGLTVAVVSHSCTKKHCLHLCVVYKILWIYPVFVELTLTSAYIHSYMSAGYDRYAGKAWGQCGIVSWPLYAPFHKQIFCYHLPTYQCSRKHHSNIAEMQMKIPVWKFLKYGRVILNFAHLILQFSYGMVWFKHNWLCIVMMSYQLWLFDWLLNGSNEVNFMIKCLQVICITYT